MTSQDSDARILSRMLHTRHITLTVRYEPGIRYGRSLTWLAPELGDAGLALIEDHTTDTVPWRTWAGTVDEPTYERFAATWRLSEQGLRSTTMSGGKGQGAFATTIDGMNWEIDGDSPIVSVSVQVARPSDSANGRCT
jgi:hypothetical protein